MKNNNLMTNHECLKDIIVNDLSFEVIKDDGYSKKNFESYTVILKVTNHSASEKEIELTFRYTSILFGLMLNDYKESNDENLTRVATSTFNIKPISFGFLRVDFDEITDVRDGDRMELVINEKRKLRLVRNRGEWYVFYKQTKAVDFSKHPEFNRLIEHFETIEDRMGIIIQNFSVTNCTDGTFYVDFEILATRDNYYKKPFRIYTVIYDRENNIVAMESDFTGWDGFKGYGKFGVNFNNFDFPIYEIGLIRIYPKDISL